MFDGVIDAILKQIDVHGPSTWRVVEPVNSLAVTPIRHSGCVE